MSEATRPPMPNPRIDPAAARAAQRALHLARAVEALRQGHLATARREVDAVPTEGLSLDDAFELFHTEIAAQAQQLRDDQSRVERSLDWFATLFRTLPVAAVMLDRRLTITHVNDCAEAELALDPESVRRGLPLRRLLARDADELHLLPRLGHGAALRIDELTLRALDGQLHWVDARITPAPYAELDAEGDAFLCVFIDRTERVALQRVQDRVAQVQREREIAQAANHAKSLMLARVSHELRTPLHAILGFSEMLRLADPPLPPQKLEWVSHIEFAGKHLLALVEEVLDLNQAEIGSLPLAHHAVRVTELARQMLALHEVSARKRGVQLSLSSADPDLMVDGEHTRVQQILDNLLSNAVKYNRPDGEVVVTVQPEGRMVRIDVTDTGRGMRPDQLEHLFEAFNRLGAEARPEVPGRGLGLHLARSMARAMGGELQATSIPDTGSCFTLRLRRWE